MNNLDGLWNINRVIWREFFFNSLHEPHPENIVLSLISIKVSIDEFLIGIAV